MLDITSRLGANAVGRMSGTIAEEFIANQSGNGLNFRPCIGEKS
jgi:hypothetical protein